MKTKVASEPIYRVLEEMGRRVRRVREEAEASLRTAEEESTEHLESWRYRQTAFIRDANHG